MALLDEAVARIGADVTFVSMPFARLLQEAKRGGAGMGHVFKTKDREAFLDFSHPYFRYRVVAFGKKSTVETFDGLDALKGKKIAVNRGVSFGDEIDAFFEEQGIDLVETDDAETCLRMVIHDRVDTYLTTELIGLSLLPRLEGGEAIRSTDWPIATYDVYFAFNKLDRQTDLLARMNWAIVQMRADGVYQEIVAREVREAYNVK